MHDLDFPELNILAQNSECPAQSAQFHRSLHLIFPARELSDCEFPFTDLFAVVPHINPICHFREH
jgi:hypothetical protein